MSNKKKILIVAPYGFNGRMANFVEFVTARLLAKNNWRVIALARHENEKKSTDWLYGIRIHKYKNLFQGIFFLLKTLIIIKPSVIHVHNLRNNRLGIITALLAKSIGTPLIFTEYGLLHNHYLTDDRDDPLNSPIKTSNVIANVKQALRRLKKKGQKKWLDLIKNYFFNWPLTHADWVVFVSKHNLPLAKELGLKNYIYLPYIFDDARWEIKETDEDPNQNRPRALKMIEKLGGSPFGFFIGQLKLRKGWDIYLRAIPLVDKAIIPYFVLITSSASQPPEFFSQMVKNLGIEDRIIFFGKVSGEILKKIYDLCSIVVVPSRYEGFGLAAIEAFESKKPLIAAAVEALTETAIDDYNGLLVPPKNPEKLALAICRLAQDQALVKKIIAGGQATLRRLKSDELKNQWLNFYEKLLIIA